MSNQDHEKPNHGERKIASLLNQDIIRKCIDLFDRLPIGIYRTTPQGEVLTANPAFISLLGYNNFEDLEGIDLNKTHKSPEDRLQFIREIEENGAVYAKESVLVDSDGKEINVEEYARVYKDANGDSLFYEGIVIDITGKIKDRERIAFLNGFKELILTLTTSFINIRLADIDNMITYSLGRIGEFIGADRSYIFLFEDDEMKFMSNTHESLADRISSVIDELQDIRTSDYSWWMDNLKKNKSILIRDVNELPPDALNEKDIFIKQNIKSLFAVPMFFDYRLIGFLGFDMVRSQKLVDNEILELLNIAASQFANILNYQKTELDLIENHKNLQTLVQEKSTDILYANEQLRMIAENSNDVIWAADMNLNNVFISPSVFRHLGFTAEEYISEPFEKRLPPESFEKFKDVFMKELELVRSGKKHSGEQSIIIELLFLTKNGSEVWGEVSFNFLFDVNGKPTGIHGITRNINDRKLAEIALWESNERFKALVENTSDWIWEVDPNGIFTYTSPVCEAMIGYSVHELVGQSFTFMLDPSCYENNLNFFRNTIVSKKPFRNYENIAVHQNGRKVFFQVSGIPIFNANEEFVGFRGITRDITEKKSIESALRQSQLKLTQHLRNTPMGYIEWDNHLEVIEWNPAAQKIFGYNKSEALVENMIEKLVPPELRDEVLEVFPAVTQSRKPAHKINHCLTRDGRLILCEWFNTPLIDEADNVIGLASLVREIPNTE